MSQVRAPAVAGSFYPATAAELRSQVAVLLASAGAEPGRRPKALIAPHAGYVYSGPIAAQAYRLLADFRNEYSRVVLLGPAHHVHVRGLALPGAEFFSTPLGEIPLDLDAIAAIRKFPQVRISSEAHALEHSLEVHLPFLQQTLSGFKLVPLAVGDASAAEVAEVLAALWGDEKTLIVASSDLSHYLPYPQAKAVDDETARLILSMTPRLDHQQACGATPVNGLLLEGRARGLSLRLLDLRNSGDTAGDKRRVVGYASFALFEEPAREEQEIDDGRALISVARSSISGKFGIHFSIPDGPPFLHRPGASFVTLRQRGKLRGCIGSLEARRSLLEDVSENARAAAFQDPRFEPLRFEELRTTRIEVSVLSRLEPISFTDQEEAIAKLRPGTDGVVLEFGRSRGTFLPQVWETLPSPAQFFSELKRKAGLTADFWDPAIRLSRYTVSKWAEPEASS